MQLAETAYNVIHQLLLTCQAPSNLAVGLEAIVFMNTNGQRPLGTHQGKNDECRHTKPSHRAASKHFC